MMARSTSTRFRALAQAAIAIVAWSVAPTVFAQAAPADAEAHKAMMNDAADAQEDYRSAFAEKNAKAATEALTKLERFMAQTEAYWSAKKMADIVKLAQTARGHAARARTAAQSGKLADANDAFGQLTATCNTCHDLHPEKR
jgi:electron transfer flavoprotein alpha subunit